MSRRGKYTPAEETAAGLHAREDDEWLASVREGGELESGRVAFGKAKVLGKYTVHGCTTLGIYNNQNYCVYS